MFSNRIDWLNGVAGVRMTNELKAFGASHGFTGDDRQRNRGARSCSSGRRETKQPRIFDVCG